MTLHREPFTYAFLKVKNTDYSVVLQITVQFCLSTTVSLHLSLASGKEVFSSEETDHHAAQQGNHLGAAHHHQLAVGARDHSSSQTTPKTNTTSRTNPRPQTHRGPLLFQNF